MMARSAFRTSSLLGLLLALPSGLLAAGPKLERVVIDANFPDGYQVEVADVNGDGKPDLVALGGGTCAWYENPSWTKRIVTGPDRSPDIISSATADIDGDGKAEIAIAYDFAMNEPRRGKLLLATQGKTLDDPWVVGHVADIGSIHRLRWYYQLVLGSTSVAMKAVQPGPNILKPGEKRYSTFLLVAPLFGPLARPPVFDQEPAHLIAVAFNPYSKPSEFGGGLDGSGGLGSSDARITLAPPAFLGKWSVIVPESNSISSRIGDAAVTHAVDVGHLDGNLQATPDILTASNQGVTWCQRLQGILGSPHLQTRILTPGAPGKAPKQGASEIHAGKLKDGRRFLATVEPWHGSDVVVYPADPGKPGFAFGPRTVVDTTLVDGHALWVADLDGDGEDEILAGYRGGSTGVNLYHREGDTWTKTVVDSDIAAQDLRGGDLDGDGRPDVVAIGGKTHNLVWYRPTR